MKLVPRESARLDGDGVYRVFTRSRESLGGAQAVRPPPRAQGRLPDSCLSDLSVPAGGERRRAVHPSCGV